MKPKLSRFVNAAHPAPSDHALKPDVTRENVAHPRRRELPHGPKQAFEDRRDVMLRTYVLSYAGSTQRAVSGKLIQRLPRFQL